MYPPGSYTMRVSVIGYATFLKTEVRVEVDRTTEASFVLSSEAIAGTEVTVTAERLLIQKDVSATVTTLTIVEAGEIPAERFEHILAIQPGVEYLVTEVASNGKTSGASNRGFSIRGGNVDETDILLDGFSLQNRHLNNSYLGINKSALQEIQIQTGGFTAEYGNIRSGLINAISRNGDPNRYEFVADFRYGPPQQKHFGENAFDGAEWRTFNGDYAQTGVPQELWGTEEYPIWFTSSGGVTTKTYAEDSTVTGWVGWENYTTGGAGNRYSENDLTPASKQELWAYRHRARDYADQPDFEVDFGFNMIG